LGPSGCGKTTLLKCVVGHLKPTSGSVKVFGYEPGESGSQVPGPGVGYMPQEVSIYDMFTIEETLIYFGKINCVDQNTIEKRTTFLIKFLDLPDKDRSVESLSGGQKRRVSLAAALVHSPPLLILDEPTVGVDPLLRQVIWKYLVRLARVDQITIIITTHYVEEAGQADLVGLMRNGRLLAESPPQDLIKQLGVKNLEEVFLRLCMDEEKSRRDDQESIFLALENEKDMESRLAEQAMNHKERQSSPMCVWCKVLLAMMWKNYLRLKRNPPVIVFEFILPALQVILFCYCVGGDPFDVPLAIVNEESVPKASILFLSSINYETFDVTYYQSLGEAIESVREGKNWGVVHIPENYTQHLQDRLFRPSQASNLTIANGTIAIYPDLTNLHLSLTIESSFRDAFIKFTRSALEWMDYNTLLAELPVKMQQPIYGGDGVKPSYLEFMAPGVVISLTYVMATGLTALAFILEKRDGLMERSEVAGVSTTQILLAHVFIELIVMLFQISLLLVVTFYFFQIPSRGPFYVAIPLILLQGCVGMGFGLLISSICSQENTAIMMLVGTFYINLTLSGIIWPIEAMPRILRFIGYFQPQTIPVESLRHILSRGWSIDRPSVYMGFVVSLAWLLFFLIGASICMRYKK